MIVKSKKKIKLPQIDGYFLINFRPCGDNDLTHYYELKRKAIRIWIETGKIDLFLKESV